MTSKGSILSRSQPHILLCQKIQLSPHKVFFLLDKESIIKYNIIIEEFYIIMENKMKKIICILLSALLLCTSFAISAFAATSYSSTVGGNTFKLNTTSESEIVFEMTDANLEDITIDYFNKIAFDTNRYDATYYGAYRASLTVDGQADAAFSEEMSVSFGMNENCADKEIFVFYVTPEITISEKVPFTREGTTITISGDDFEKMADRIIVVMTGEEIAPSTSPIIPAAICVGVAIVAIVISIIVVKRKKANAGIVEQ